VPCLTSTSSLVHFMSVMRGTEYSTAIRRVRYPCVTNDEAARVPALLAGRLMTRSNPLSDKKSASIHCRIDPACMSAGHQFNGSIYTQAYTVVLTQPVCLQATSSMVQSTHKHTLSYWPSLYVCRPPVQWLDLHTSIHCRIDPACMSAGH